MTTHIFDGRCHCGNLSYVFKATASLDELGLRACQCSFCRAHGTRTTSDPAGVVQLRIHDDSRLTRYRFGLKTADFLICTRCGVFIGAMFTEAERSWMTINVNTFASPPLAHRLTPMNFASEDTAARIARRKAKWTPVAP